MRLILPLLFLAAAAAAVPPTPTPELLTTVLVGRKGAEEVCLSGAKAEGAALLFRVEIWRGKTLVGTAEVPDRDKRAVFAQCRTFTAPAIAGDSLKVYSLGARPKSLTVNPRPGGLPD